MPLRVFGTPIWQEANSGIDPSHRHSTFHCGPQRIFTGRATLLPNYRSRSSLTLVSLSCSLSILILWNPRPWGMEHPFAKNRQECRVVSQASQPVGNNRHHITSAWGSYRRSTPHRSLPTSLSDPSIDDSTMHHILHLLRFIRSHSTVTSFQSCSLQFPPLLPCLLGLMLDPVIMSSATSCPVPEPVRDP